MPSLRARWSTMCLKTMCLGTMRLQTVCLVAISLFLPTLLSAQGASGRVLGRVADPTGEPSPRSLRRGDGRLRHELPGGPGDHARRRRRLPPHGRAAPPPAAAIRQDQGVGKEALLNAFASLPASRVAMNTPPARLALVLYRIDEQRKGQSVECAEVLEL